MFHLHIRGVLNLYKILICFTAGSWFIFQNICFIFQSHYTIIFSWRILSKFSMLWKGFVLKMRIDSTPIAIYRIVLQWVNWVNHVARWLGIWPTDLGGHGHANVPPKDKTHFFPARASHVSRLMGHDSGMLVAFQRPPAPCFIGPALARTWRRGCGRDCQGKN